MFPSATVRRIAMLSVIPGSLVLAGSPALAANTLGAVFAPADAPASTPVSEAASLTSPAQRMLKLTLDSAQTRDMRGVEPSMYRGSFFGHPSKPSAVASPSVKARAKTTSSHTMATTAPTRCPRSWPVAQRG